MRQPLCLVTGDQSEVIGLVTTSVAREAVAQSQPDDAGNLLVEEASAALKAGNYKKAGRLLDRALAANPRSIRAYILRASVHGVLEEYDRGVAIMRRAEELAPDNPDVLTALGSQLMFAKRYDEGVTLLERVVEKWPERYDAQVVIGHYYAKRHRWRKAIGAFEAYFRSRPSVLAGEDQTHRVELANAYLRSDEPRVARDLYRIVLQREPGSILGRLGLAWSTAAIDCREAIPLLATMPDLARVYSEIMLVHGRCELAVGNHQQAEEMAKRYQRGRPDDAAGWAFLGDVRVAQGEFSRGVAALAEAHSLESGNRVWAFKLARAERLAGRPNDAVARLRRIGVSSGSKPAWTLELGESLLAAGEYARVRQLLTPFIADHPEDAHAHTMLGLAYVELGDTVKAVRHLELALAGDTRLAERVRGPLVSALNTEAAAGFAKSDIEAAERSLERAGELSDDPATWRNLGAIRMGAGRVEQAIIPLEKAARAGDDAGCG